MTGGLIAHIVLSCLSGLSVSVTGFGCDIARELLHLLVVGDDVYAPASAINTGLAAALVTGVQVSRQLMRIREREIRSPSPSLITLALMPAPQRSVMVTEQNAAELSWIFVVRFAAS